MIRAIFIVLMVFALGCGETHPFTPAKSIAAAAGSDDTIEFIGKYELSNGSGSMEVNVYHVTINGRRREVHWNGIQAFGVLNLEESE